MHSYLDTKMVMTFILKKNAFAKKLEKIAEICAHNIDPWWSILCMITNVCVFCQFSAKNWRFSQKRMLRLIFFAKNGQQFEQKTQIFSPKFSANI
jgi:hypothetical protein